MPSGMVGVEFRGRGRGEYWLVSPDDYHRRSELHGHATPDDFRTAGIQLTPWTKGQ